TTEAVMNEQGCLFTSESVSMGHPDKMADQIPHVSLDALGPNPTLTLVANSLQRMTGPSLGKIGCPGDRNPGSPTPWTNSPPVSTLVLQVQSSEPKSMKWTPAIWASSSTCWPSSSPRTFIPGQAVRTIQRDPKPVAASASRPILASRARSRPG